MLTTTQGVVIAVTDLKENDRIIKVLSPDMGLIDISAKGAKKQSSSFNSTTQLFSCAKYCFNERGGRYYLNSSEPVKIFYGLRLDMQKLALASYLANILRYAVTEGQTANDVYRLFLNCLYLISEKNASCDFIKFIFEMRVTADLGMMPALLGCMDCNRSLDVQLYFLIKRGIFLCDYCMEQRHEFENRYTVPVTDGMLEAMRFVCLADMDRIFNFRVSDEALKKLGYISELYAQEQLNAYFDTLSFYKQVSEEYNQEDQTL